MLHDMRTLPTEMQQTCRLPPSITSKGNKPFVFINLPAYMPCRLNTVQETCKSWPQSPNGLDIGSHQLPAIGVAWTNQKHER